MPKAMPTSARNPMSRPWPFLQASSGRAAVQEAIEPLSESLTIRPPRRARRNEDALVVKPLEKLEHRAVLVLEETPRNADLRTRARRRAGPGRTHADESSRGSDRCSHAA